MKKNLIIFLLISLVSVSCYKVKKPEKPSNLIPKNKMITILVDMAIMSSAKGIDKKKLEINGIVPETYLYEKHNIDSALFSQSNIYYAFDIKAYDAIYAKVKDSLTFLRDKYKAVETKEKKEKEKKDSLKRAKVAAEKALINEKKGGPKLKKPVLEGQLNPSKN